MEKEEKLKRQREASKRWKEKNPESYKASRKKYEDKRKEIKRYDAEKRKNWYQKKRKDENWSQKIRNQEIERSKKIKEFLANFKLEKGCSDCGYKEHHVALDFDHIKDKSFHVCNAKSISQAKKEIEKCEVVCSNCHRIRTFNRLKNL